VTLDDREANVEQGSTPVELLATNIRTREQAEPPQTNSDVSQPDQVETGVSDEVHLVDEMTDRDDEDTAIFKGSEVANIQAPPADLLNIIWQCLQKDREERRAERKQDDEIRRRDEEARLAAEKRNDERLAKLREDIINSAEIVSRQFRGELDKQVNIIDRKIGTLN
jgi:hypothetical protein